MTRDPTRDFTIDASVWVGRIVINDTNHADSVACLNRMARQKIRLICPTLALVETVASVMRITGDARAAWRASRVVRLSQNIRFISLTIRRSVNTSLQTETSRLRGADAVYANVAWEFDATLITRDKEMYQRAKNLVPVLTPTEWLAQNTAQSGQ